MTIINALVNTRVGNAYWYSFSMHLQKHIAMKTQNQNQDAKNARTNPKVSQSGGKRPETRDNLDHRSNEEQEFKGDDVTHNEKPSRGKNKAK